MADPTSSPGGIKWFWIAAIVLLAILLLVWLFNPAGDTDEAVVEDPIVTPELGEPAAGGAEAQLTDEGEMITELPADSRPAAPTPGERLGSELDSGPAAGRPIATATPEPQ